MDPTALSSSIKYVAGQGLLGIACCWLGYRLWRAEKRIEVLTDWIIKDGLKEFSRKLDDGAKRIDALTQTIKNMLTQRQG